MRPPRVAEELDELRLEIIDEHLIRAEHDDPFDYGQLEVLLDE